MSSMLTQLLQNAAAAGLVVFSGVNNVIPSTGAMQWVQLGTTQIVSEDIIRYLTTGQSLILGLNYYELFDQIFFASGFVYGLSKVGATQSLLRVVDNSLGSVLPQMATDALVDGSLIMLNRTTYSLLESMPQVSSTPLKYLIHPSYLVTQGV